MNVNCGSLFITLTQNALICPNLIKVNLHQEANVCCPVSHTHVWEANFGVTRP